MSSRKRLGWCKLSKRIESDVLALNVHAKHRFLNLLLSLLVLCGLAQPLAATVANEQIVNGTAIVWIEDDYPAALALARREAKPILIDMWAAWCHSCLSMKHTTLIDPDLRPFADRFVWLAIDTERAVNAPTLGKYKIAAWPTFLVISPFEESVQARHLGSASVEQFIAFLQVGESGHRAAMAEQEQLDPHGPEGLARRGDRAALADDPATAAQAYSAALDAAPADWPRRPDILAARIGALYAAKEYGACVDLAIDSAAGLIHGISAGVGLSYAGACADRLSEDDPRRAALSRLALGQLARFVDAPGASLTVDDRSDILMLQREYFDRLGDTEAARRTAQRQRVMLDRAAADAATPYEASTYNWPRAEVYVYLGLGAELIPALEASAKALPEEADPPYRLAWVHYQLKQYEQSLMAAERALALAYGPRKAGIQGMLARLHHAMGNRQAERKAREAQLALLQALPSGQRDFAAEKQVREALASLQTK